MHADKDQNERTVALKSFIEGRYHVIVSTGILARGVDLLNVKQVSITWMYAWLMDMY